jgi:predicted PurR-regulated permease PerM
MPSSAGTSRERRARRWHAPWLHPSPSTGRPPPRAVDAVEAAETADDAAADASEAAAVAIEAADAATADDDEVPLAQLLAPETDADIVQVAHLDWRSGAWIAAGLFSSFLLIGLLRNTPASLTRIGVGVLLAFALDPVVVRIGQRLGISRAEAVGLVSLGVAAVFAFLVFVLGPPAIQQAEEFGRELPDTVEQAYTFPVVGGWLEDQNAAQEVRTWAEDLPGRVDTDSITEVARSVLDGVLAAVMVLVVGLAVLLDGDRLVGRLLAALPDNVEPGAVRVGRTFSRTLGAYFAGSLLVASLAAIFILAVGLAFGVPLAPAAALWMLVVNLIPQIGGFLGGSFFVILAVTQGLGTGIICLVLFLVYQQFENHVIQPVVVGQAVDLSPPATMLAALVGGGRGRHPRGAGGHAAGGRGQVALPRAALGPAPGAPRHHRPGATSPSPRSWPSACVSGSAARGPERSVSAGAQSCAPAKTELGSTPWRGR